MNNSFPKFEYSHKMLKDLVENSFDCFIVLEKEGAIVFANKAACVATGYDKNELIGKSFFDFISEGSRKNLKNYIDRLSKNKYSIKDFDFKIIDKKNLIKYLNLCSCSVITENGSAKIQLIARDITEKKNLENMIEKSKSHFVRMIDAIQDSICTVNHKYQIVSCNKKFAENVNIPLKKIKDKNFRSIITRFKNNLFADYAKGGSHSYLLKKCFESKKEISFKEKKIGNDGKDYYYRVKVYPLKDSNEKIYEAVISIRNISDVERATQRIIALNELNNRILNNAPISIITLDQDGQITSTNKYYHNISATDDIGKNIYNLKFIKKQNLLSNYKLLLRKGVIFQKNNCVIHSPKNKQIKYLNIIGVPLKNSKGQIEGAISMALDNTKSILYQRELNNLNKELENKIKERTEELNNVNQKLQNVLELKSRFISDASHELRTPLTIMRGFLDIAVREIADKGIEVPESMEIIQHEINKSAKILTELKFLTEADAQKQFLSFKKIDLPSLLKSQCKAFKVLAEKKNIKLTFSSANKKIIVLGDVEKMEKLVSNIINNAIKYTDENGWVKVDVKKEKKEALISVRDNGIGISAEDLPNIFERFYRVNTGREVESSGLGLAICKWIAEAHNGSISVESKPTKGSSFTIHLPIK